MNRSAAGRFWSKVRKGAPDDCWLWTGAVSRAGYGNFWTGSYYTHAHRAAYMLAHGPIPKGTVIMHKCDCARCVNPSHLLRGTQLENIRDMIAKGRRGYTGLKGERNPKSKLTREEVHQIRQEFKKGQTRAELARTYSVNWTTINRIVKRRYWRRLKM